MMKEKGLYAASKKGKSSIDRKRADQLCGRVIVRDIESSQNSILEIAMDASHLDWTPSIQNGIPYLFFGTIPQDPTKSVNAINKTLELLGLKKKVPENRDLICGKLIAWDVGTFRENRINLQDTYSPPRYTPALKGELSPYTPPPLSKLQRKVEPVFTSASIPVPARFLLKHP